MTANMPAIIKMATDNLLNSSYMTTDLEVVFTVQYGLDPGSVEQNGRLQKSIDQILAHIFLSHIP